MPLEKTAGAAVAAVLLLAAAPAAAVAIGGGVTTVDVTADLAGLGLAGAPFGSATVEIVDGLPRFSFPITGGELADDGSALIEHEGSGVTLSALADPSISATVGGFLIDTAGATVFGDVIGGPQDLALFTLGDVTDDGVALLIGADLAGALTGAFGADDLTGAQFGLANTAPTPVPVPGAAVALLTGLAAFAAFRRRAG